MRSEWEKLEKRLRNDGERIGWPSSGSSSCLHLCVSANCELLCCEIQLNATFWRVAAWTRTANTHGFGRWAVSASNGRFLLTFYFTFWHLKCVKCKYLMAPLGRRRSSAQPHTHTHTHRHRHRYVHLIQSFQVWTSFFARKCFGITFSPFSGLCIVLGLSQGSGSKYA